MVRELPSKFVSRHPLMAVVLCPEPGIYPSAKATMLIGLLFLIAVPLTADVKPKRKREFPARLKVVSHRVDDLDNLHLKVSLDIDADVCIYANPVVDQELDHLSAKLTVLDADGKALDVKIKYPTGEKSSSEFIGDYYVYKKTADIEITVTEAKKRALPLKICICVVAFNERRFCCLGGAQLETYTEFDENKTEQ